MRRANKNSDSYNYKPVNNQNMSSNDKSYDEQDKQNIKRTMLSSFSSFSLLLTIILAIALLSTMAAANAPVITINNPSYNNYYWTDFMINATTDITANCTFSISFLNGTTITTGALDGNTTTSHNATLDYSTIPHAYNLTITITCINDTNATEQNTTSTTFLADAVCGDHIIESWALGHDLECQTTGPGLSIDDNVVLDCDDYTINASGSHTPTIRVDGNNTVIKGCTIVNDGYYGVVFPTENTGTTIEHNNFIFYGNSENDTAIMNFAPLSSLTITNNNFTKTAAAFDLIGFNNITIFDNTINNVGYDLYFENGTILNFTSNDLTGSYNGLYLKNITDYIITHNDLQCSTDYGMKIEESSGLIAYNNMTGAANALNLTNNIAPAKITMNNLTATGVGLYLYNSQNLKFYKNIINSPLGAYSNNPVDLSYNGEGNYWGRDNSCPAFLPGIDSNSVTVIDNFAYDKSDFSSYGCDCGDDVVASVILTRNITCPSRPYALRITQDNINLDCNGKTIKSTGTATSAISAYNLNNITISNCYITSYFTKGIDLLNTNNSIITNITAENLVNNGDGSYAGPGAGLLMTDCEGITLTNSNFTGGGESVEITNSTNITIINNSLGNLNDFSGPGVGITIHTVGIITNLVMNNNYWYRDSCPLFLYGREIDNLIYYDTNPIYGDGSPNNCTPQLVAKRIYKTGYSALLDYNSTNDWYYLYNGVTPALEVELIPGLFRIYSVVFAAENSTILTTTPNSNFTTWKVNNTLLLNYDNFTTNPQLPMSIVITDPNYAGPISVFTGIININPINNKSVAYTPFLGGVSTDWSTITDFSNYTGLTFEKEGYGKIEFLEPVNLLSSAFLQGLNALRENLQFGNAMTALNTTVEALRILNKSARITLNISVITGFNSSEYNTTEIANRILMDNEPCENNCTLVTYDNSTGIVSFNVPHWTSYSVDITPPTITSTLPTISSFGYTVTTVTIGATTNEEATCKYDTVDTTYDNMTYNMTGTNTTHEDVVNVSSGHTYKYYVRCKDKVNNAMTNSTTIEFTVASESHSGGGGGGSGGAYFPGLTTYSETAVTLSNYGYYQFVLPGTSEVHKITVKSMGEDWAELQIESETVVVKINKGETKKVDLTGDGLADLQITLTGLSQYAVYLKLKALDETSETSTTTEDNKGTTHDVETTGTTSTTSNTEDNEKNEEKTSTTEKTTTNENAEKKSENQKTENKTTNKGLLEGIDPWVWYSLLVLIALLALVKIFRKRRY